MAWEHLSITKPHLVYIILGGFTSLFMLCSSFIKERLYIGEATVATICGVIFGPHAANLINPLTWGNTDSITLEFSRIVLVVQCFAVGVELPKYYMEKHWRSMVFLLLPVMTYGWLITSLFIWWMIPRLSWLESLCVAACVTATDPVLASSVVGKGKFAKRIPKHLRDVLSAESGCNDGMAFPFVYLALYLIEDHLSAKEVTYHWFTLTILYECIFGCLYGFIIGYIGRHGIKYAERHDLVDRESFLVFYFVLALFCAGSGSVLGVDDLLVGFSAGVGFSNDGWFTQKTEESHVSNVIDLLLNLAYFVYLGTIIPWQQYNEPSIGTTPWRLVVISLFVIFFRRIPVMLALKPFIPDVKTWREALFAGHFGPIGVGAIFVAILARAELETGHTTPLASYPETGAPNATLVALIWPIVTFLVITSIIVHGSSIAVFTLGKHINTLTLTMSYTTAGEEGPGWMNRLPRISSTSRSQAKTQESDIIGEKIEYPPGTLPPVGYPGNFLRRQKEEDDPSRAGSRTSSLRPLRRKTQWSDGIGPGGPVTQSAIFPQRRSDSTPLSQRTEDTLTPGDSTPEEKDKEKSSSSDDSTKGEGKLGDVQHDSQMEEIMHPKSQVKGDSHKSDAERHPDDVEVYDEGDNIIIENEDGEVLTTQQTPGGMAHHDTAKKLEAEIKKDIQHPFQSVSNVKKMIGTWKQRVEDRKYGEKGKGKEAVHKRGPALAYQFGNTIIVEDEDGEVVKKYELPTTRDTAKPGDRTPRQGLRHMSTWTGYVPKKVDSNIDPNASSSSAAPPPPPSTLSRVRTGLQRRGTGLGFNMGKVAEEPKDGEQNPDDDDRHIRFTIGHGGKRLTKEDFIREIQSLDPKARCEVVEQSDAPAVMKEMAKKDAHGHNDRSDRLLKHKGSPVRVRTAKEITAAMAKRRGEHTSDTDTASDEEGLSQSPSTQVPESVAERRRREEVLKEVLANDSDSESEGRRGRDRKSSKGVEAVKEEEEEEETQAEKRRREAALGLGGKGTKERDEDSDDDDTMRIPPPLVPERSTMNAQSTQSGSSQPRGIRFAEEPVRGRSK